MRRQLHAMVVGLLAGSLALDTARAGRRSTPCGRATVVVAASRWDTPCIEHPGSGASRPVVTAWHVDAAAACDPCQTADVIVAAPCGPCDDPLPCAGTVVAWQEGVEEAACCAGDADHVVVTADTGLAPTEFAPPATDAIVDRDQTPPETWDQQPAAAEPGIPPAVEQAQPVPPAAEPAATPPAPPAEPDTAPASVLVPSPAEAPAPTPAPEPLPDLKPVEPPAPPAAADAADADQPAVAKPATDQPAAAPAAPQPVEPAPAPPPPPPKPIEENLFEEAEGNAVADDAAPAAPAPAAEAAPAAPPAPEPTPEAPAAEPAPEPAPSAPATEPAPEPAAAAPTAEPAADPDPAAPAAEPAAEPQPVPPTDPPAAPGDAPADPAQPPAAAALPAAATLQAVAQAAAPIALPAPAEAAALNALPDPAVIPAGAVVEPSTAGLTSPPTLTVVPGDDLQPAPRRSVAPLRRWIDDTGRNATVGRLLSVTDAVVTIRKANGRVVRVPLDRLSDHDRAYVESVEMPAPADTPASSDTVGL